MPPLKMHYRFFEAGRIGRSIVRSCRHICIVVPFSSCTGVLVARTHSHTHTHTHTHTRIQPLTQTNTSMRLRTKHENEVIRCDRALAWITNSRRLATHNIASIRSQRGNSAHTTSLHWKVAKEIVRKVCFSPFASSSKKQTLAAASSRTNYWKIWI